MEHTEDEMDLSILELKTCPFCGGSAKVLVKRGLKDTAIVTIKCGCGASLSKYVRGDCENMQDILTALDEAKKLWNTEKERGIWKPIDWSKARKV